MLLFLRAGSQKGENLPGLIRIVRPRRGVAYDGLLGCIPLATYRVYYTPRGREIILLLMGGDKSSQEKDIRLALKLARKE